MCTKAPFMFMPLLIPGPTDPIKDLHVYLRPLIDELKILWRTGVETYDRLSCTNFMMRATLMWTISDFTELGMLSGWSTEGKLTCHICVRDVKGKQLKHGGKPSFYGTARYFLEPNDSLRRSTKFGSRKTRSVTTRHSGLLARAVCEDIQFPPPGKISDKNKTKDKDTTREDCKELGLHRDLWIQDDGTKPNAPYVHTREQVHKLFKWIEELKLPDGCVSNISSCHMGDVLTELSNFFQDFCASNLKYTDLEKTEKDIVKILSKLETIYIPGFFDPMEHLPVHLSTKCKLGGPANCRWMYFVKRYLHGLKMKVKNKARPEGSMAERYIEEESVHFCSLYFEEKFKTVHNKLRCNEVTDNRGVINPKFKDLIRGPMTDVETYNGCLCNGYKFGCGNLNERTSQNSGVVVIGSSYKESYGNYYRRLLEVLKLHYHNGHDVILFKCHWFDHTTHVKMDINRITTVDVRSRLNVEDVFILASQAHQVVLPSLLYGASFDRGGGGMGQKKGKGQVIGGGRRDRDMCGRGSEVGGRDRWCGGRSIDTVIRDGGRGRGDGGRPKSIVIWDFGRGRGMVERGRLMS
ncbi:uncharacterized protein LOC141679868 [Apium graveolens]|uniref:uncharacterized protein LOC141679868 n=1 Tax=Apium graveolens TaxID=4045 RepID=UPI003D78B7F8